MACTEYQRLVAEWMILIYKPHSDQEAVAAYWEAIDHRASCEVCRDECLFQGCFSIYYTLASSKKKQLRRSSI
jgi:hypothetical protein